MRSLMLSMAFFSLVKMCGGSDEAATPPIGAAAAGAITVSAQHGGVMVSADDAWIELVTKDNGDVEAYVVDAQGQPLSHEVAQVSAVQVQAQDGSPHQVQLQWDATAHRYAGHAEVRPVATAPAEVHVVVRGQPRRARAPQIVLVAAPPQAPGVVVRAPDAPRTVVVTPPQPRAGATVVVEAPQPPRATVVVQGPQPPRGTVVIGGPPPPPGVVVVAPPPPRPGVVVVAPQPRVDVVVRGDHDRRVDEDDDRDFDEHPGRGRGHAYGRRGRAGGGTVVVSPPHPGSVVVSPPHPGRVEVRGGGGGGRIEVRGGGRGRGRGR